MSTPKGYIELTILFRPEAGKWTAECLELGTAAYGDSLDEAVEAIEGAMELHLNTLEDVGERERFLKERNIKIHRIAPKPTTNVKVKNIPYGAFIHPEIREIACV